jgi:UDPglucose 6-dehydrogenase
VTASSANIAVYGLWHLGSTLCAAWSKLGHSVVGIDPDSALVQNLQKGKAPLYEPGLDDLIQQNLQAKRLRFSTDARDASSASFIFVAYDTPIDDQDRSNLEVIHQAVDSLVPHLSESAILVLSAQLPVGAARRIRERIQKTKAKVEVAYSPENLRLGEALSCYLQPGHIVIGTENEKAASRLKELFAPMKAEVMSTNLPTAEMTKHGINSFLAASVTLANQLADLCDTSGADVTDVIRVMRLDPRIGPKAYLSPGVGFSGGTLGRDLQVLEEVSKASGNIAPLFGSLWKWNQQRYELVRKMLNKELKNLQGLNVGILGLTYKPGTSTLRRSLPLRIALDLHEAGAKVRVFDPKADFSQSEESKNFVVCKSARDAAEKSDAMVVLTGWPEFRELDWKEIKTTMKSPTLFDPANFLQSLALDKKGFRYIGLGRGK